ncbi:unnamed protein product [Calicophoron daubneyi]|uniref:Uncharacterized protein n=1 Tax=Calicophoron daubneyi TaxID=300641 RepID=A0AAV2T8B0_CALDB
MNMMIRDSLAATNDKAFMQWNIPPLLLKKPTGRNLPAPTAPKGGDRQPEASAPKTKCETPMETKCTLVLPKGSDQTEEEKWGEMTSAIKKADQYVEACNPAGRKRFRPVNTSYSDDVKKVVTPRAEPYVRKWLNTTTPAERTTALRAFYDLAKAEKPSEVKSIVENVLTERERSFQYPNYRPHPIFSHGDGSTQLQYLHLLGKEQRRDRWMHKSWHHLPPYEIDEEAGLRDNRGSHYTRPRKFQPRQFVIHPEIE